MESDFDKFGSDNDLPPQSLEVKCKQIMVDLGQFEFEKAAEENEKRKRKDFDQIYRSSSGSQNGLPKSENTNETASPRQADASVVDTVARDRQPVLGAEAVTRESSENLSFSIQQDDSGGRENISLGNIPLTSVATTLYNNYKLLLLSLAGRLLSSDVVNLMEWATQMFSIENAQNATDVLLQLDQKGIINASDLSPLRDFFESIVRFDLAHIIDTFLLGDYNLLRDPERPANTRHPGLFGCPTQTRIANVPDADTTREQRSAARNCVPEQDLSLSVEQNDSRESISLGRTLLGSLGLSLSSVTDDVVKLKDWANQNFPIENVHNVTDILLQLARKGIINASHLGKLRDFFESILRIEFVHIIDEFLVGNYSVLRQIPTSQRTTARNSATTITNPSVTNNTVGSNGLKHSRVSRFRRPEVSQQNKGRIQFLTASQSRTLDQGDINCLCDHYKRDYSVKFECCDKFWPCHLCHNDQSTCGRRKLKSSDTKMVKCNYCSKEQEVGQFCCDCGAEFATYYCGICKHLTGKDDHPYHCEKCGICKINGDRSFHCDICGICLDVKLRGNHKCREGSAHDECCVCLEDAFTGCQILPCSHKMHKDCATQITPSGMVRCPICCESFALILEGRQLPNSKKCTG